MMKLHDTHKAYRRVAFALLVGSGVAFDQAFSGSWWWLLAAVPAALCGGVLVESSGPVKP